MTLLILFTGELSQNVSHPRVIYHRGRGETVYMFKFPGNKILKSYKNQRSEPLSFTVEYGVNLNNDGNTKRRKDTRLRPRTKT